MTASAEEAARTARLLLRRSRQGVLGTHSKRFAGFTYGSAVPIAVDAQGHPVILISDLAAHTQNLREDPRVAVTVHGDDVVTGARCTLLGRTALLDPEEPAARRYLALFPSAHAFVALGDFHFHRIEPVACHYIGGFGDIRWLDGAPYLLPPLPVEDREQDIVDHMNDGHVGTMRGFCRRRLSREVTDVSMVTIDGDGFDLRADDALLRFDFPELAVDADAARRLLVQFALSDRDA